MLGTPSRPPHRPLPARSCRPATRKSATRSPASSAAPGCASSHRRPPGPAKPCRGAGTCVSRRTSPVNEAGGPRCQDRPTNQVALGARAPPFTSRGPGTTHTDAVRLDRGQERSGDPRVVVLREGAACTVARRAGAHASDRRARGRAPRPVERGSRAGCLRLGHRRVAGVLIALVEGSHAEGASALNGATRRGTGSRNRHWVADPVPQHTKLLLPGQRLPDQVPVPIPEPGSPVHVPDALDALTVPEAETTAAPDVGSYAVRARAPPLLVPLMVPPPPSLVTTTPLAVEPPT